MIILGLRTDKPQAELYLYNDLKKLTEVKWEAHLKLTETIHLRIKEILNQSSISLVEVDGIVCFKGPGSFTGLRIGLSVANALAYAQNIPVIAAGGQDWRSSGIKKLLAGKNDRVATPKYDHPASVTPPKK